MSLSISTPSLNASRLWNTGCNVVTNNLPFDITIVDQENKSLKLVVPAKSQANWHGVIFPWVNSQQEMVTKAFVVSGQGTLLFYMFQLYSDHAIYYVPVDKTFDHPNFVGAAPSSYVNINIDQNGVPYATSASTATAVVHTDAAVYNTGCDVVANNTGGLIRVVDLEDNGYQLSIPAKASQSFHGVIFPWVNSDKEMTTKSFAFYNEAGSLMFYMFQDYQTNKVYWVPRGGSFENKVDPGAGPAGYLSVNVDENGVPHTTADRLAHAANSATESVAAVAATPGSLAQFGDIAPGLIQMLSGLQSMLDAVLTDPKSKALVDLSFSAFLLAIRTGQAQGNGSRVPAAGTPKPRALSVVAAN